MGDDRGARRRRLLTACALITTAAATTARAQEAPAAASSAAPGRPVSASAPGAGAPVAEVVVTGSRLNLLGTADTASQGSVTREELELRPVYRVGQLYETVPGLTVTAHSGEGKANQYLLRGFNLDHGTDFASFVDDMPVNRPTNTHGQGYSDQNFLIAETAAGLDFTKGPYHAEVGDFGAVGSAHVRLLDVLPDAVTLSAGTLGDQRAVVTGTHPLSDDDRLAAAVEYAHLDGPWDHPDNFHKLNLELRFSHGDAANGYDLTALYYHSHGNFTTDQPQRAFDQGLIGRYGTLDPSDGNRSERFSLSGHYARSGDGWAFTSSLFYVHARMTLWNDFTHLLDDPVNGDQEEQTETRSTAGGQTALKMDARLFGFDTTTVLGAQVRYDDAYVDRRHTLRRAVLATCELEGDQGTRQFPAVDGACNADRVGLLDAAPYAETTIHLTPWLRAVLGAREEVYRATDHSLTTGFRGTTDQWLFQPKGSLVVGPFWKSELYLSAGRGFHSDDVRGVFGTVPEEGFPGAAGRTPLLAPAMGEELGLRTNLLPRLAIQLALFQEDFDSELAYDADAGQDSATAPSRRRGVELSGQYKPFRWLELNADLAFSQARYRGDLEGFGLDGRYIANAPTFIGSFGVLVDDLGPWFGALQWRRLGAYPLTDGPKDPSDKGYSEFNIDVGYRLSQRIKLQLSIFNLLDSHADAAAYFYTTRLPGEPADGVADRQTHPLEPISARFSVTASF